MFNHLELRRMSVTTSVSRLMRLSSANGAKVFADLLTLLLHVPVRTHTFKCWKWLEHIMSPESRNAMARPHLKANLGSEKRRAKLRTVGWHSQSKRNAHSSRVRCSQHLQGEQSKRVQARLILTVPFRARASSNFTRHVP